MTSAIQIEWGWKPIQYNQPWQFERENTLMLGGADHGIHHRLRAVCARPAQRRALIVSWLMLSTNSVNQIKQGSELYNTTQQPARQEAQEECNERW